MTYQLETRMLKDDLLYYKEAIRLAEEAERRGNLPIGAVIVIDGKIIARGKNSIWQPTLELTRHAEMEALRSIPISLRQRCREMTLYTTLEPCVMCAGAIMLHRIGRLEYGSSDPFGGISTCLSSLPTYFKEVFSGLQWSGPASPAICDPLYERVMRLVHAHSRDEFHQPEDISPGE